MTLAVAPLKGALLISSATFILAGMDTTTKFLVARHEIVVVLAVRFLVQALYIAVVYGPGLGREILRTRRTGLVLLRGLSLAVTALFIALCLQRLPVAETTAIFFLTPIVIALTAAPLLGEPRRWHHMLAALVGFLGVLLISMPGSGLDPLGLIFGLGAVLCNTCYQMLSRVLGATETTPALMLYASLMGIAVFAPLAILPASGGEWSLLDPVLMIMVGLASGVGHYLLTSAFRFAPASMLSPISYSQLIWASCFGIVVFSAVPSMQTIGGIVLICVAGLMLLVNMKTPA